MLSCKSQSTVPSSSACMSQQSSTRSSAPLAGATARSIAPSYTVIRGVGTLVFPPFQILCSSPCPSGCSAIIPPVETCPAEAAAPLGAASFVKGQGGDAVPRLKQSSETGVFIRAEGRQEEEFPLVTFPIQYLQPCTAACGKAGTLLNSFYFVF